MTGITGAQFRERCSIAGLSDIVDEVIVIANTREESVQGGVDFWKGIRRKIAFAELEGRIHRGLGLATCGFETLFYFHRGWVIEFLGVPRL